MNIEKIRNLYMDEQNSVEEVAEKLGLSFWKVYNLMRENNIPRRDYSQANYVKYSRFKPRFLLKENLDLNDEHLKIAGIMLYWAEGYKGGYGVDFANSDPRMIKLFLLFLRNICGIKEERLRVYLYIHEDKNIDGIKKFWNGVTQIPISQFNKPYIKKVKPDSKNRAKMPNGLIHIRYYDKKLLHIILNWIDEYIGSLK